MFESLEKLTAAVEAACADIAPSYAEYVQLAMAIATDCGEGGRADFHRICSFSPKYQSSHADRLYTNALKNGHGNVHLGTAFHLAKQQVWTSAKKSGQKTQKMHSMQRMQYRRFLTHTHTYLIMRTETDNRTQPTLRIAGKRNFQEANRCSLFHCCPKPNGRSPCNTSAATVPQEHSATCSCSERSPS